MQLQDLADPVGDYARQAIAGDIVVGHLVRKACQRHLRDLEHGAARGLTFDRALALRAIEFFPAVLKHWKGQWAGQPFELSPFQMFIIGSLFGWVWIATGLRRYRKAYIELARKNGKSALAAGIALLLLVFDGEEGAEVYTAATKKDQARIVWGDAEKFVKKSPALQRRVTIYRNNMMVPATNSVLVPLSADDNTMDGLNPHGVIVDELHAHKTRAIVDVLKTALGAREQPLMVEISTAGKNVESVCWDEHDYGAKVLEEIFEDDAAFVYIASLDEGDDWRDESVWIKANPNLGISKRLDYMKVEFRSAINKPAEQAEFKRLHLDIWTQTAGGAVKIAKWDLCAAAVVDDALKGRECVVGLDLSSTTDITAKIELFPPIPTDPIWYIRPTFWVPQAKVDAAEQGEIGDEVPYHLWHQQGFIRTTEGNVVDYDAVREDIVARSEQVHVREIGYDPWNAQQLANQLMADGFNLVEVRQGYKTLSEPTKKLFELMLGAKFAHGAHPVLRWMAFNLSVVTDDAGNQKPSKRMSKQRIDGMVALIVALQRAIALYGIDNDESVYKTRGIIAI